MGPAVAMNDQEQEHEADAALLTPLGEFMQRRNAELGLSVSAVSQRVGMSRATWYRIARGESASPGVRVLRGLARVYKVRAAELFALAEHTGALSAAPLSPAVQSVREAGDALWRCRHERRVRAGSWVDVQLELLNLSDQTWQRSEVRVVHDTWFLLGDRAARPLPACGESHGLPSCRASLPPTAPSEWAHAQMTLRAPQGTGPCIVCLSLYTEHSPSPTGTGVFLHMEAT